MRRKARRRWFRRFAVAVALAVCVAAGALYLAVRRGTSQQPTGPADVIIVLGAGSRHGRPTDVYRARLDHGRSLLERGLAGSIIVTGHAPNAEAARDYLVEQRIPPEAIAVENRSTTTLENLTFARDIMRERGWDTAIIASCPFHLFRALKMAQGLDIPAQGAAAPNSPIEKDPRAGRRMSLRECWNYVSYLCYGRYRVPR